MRKGYRRILFAVRDIDQLSPGALRKLAALARGSGARLELYHAMTETVVVPRPRGAAAGNLDTVFDALAARARQRLERVARSAALRGLKVVTHVDWDYPAHEAVIRRATATRADLVVGEAHHHALAARPFLHNTDWELIRQCPVPLLLIKGGRRYEQPAVLAAVDPFHAADKPASLDRVLLAEGARLANGLGGKLHAVHAWLPLTVLVPTAASAPVPVYLPDEVETEHEKQVRKAFTRLADRAGVRREARHLAIGPVNEVLESVQRRTRAAVVVMGAISRRGLQRLFIGNTAERMLDHLACDILVVKPPGFRTRVPARGTPRSPLVSAIPY